MMQVKRCATPQEFQELAYPFLLQNEAQNNLVLGISGMVLEKLDVYGAEPPYLAVVEDGGEVVSVVIRTPPRNILLAYGGSPESISPVIDALLAEYGTLPGVIGPEALSLPFAQGWQAKTGVSFHQEMAMGIYKLEQVKPVAGVSGSARRIVATDEALLREWIARFNEDVFGHSPAGDDVEGVYTRFTSSEDRGMWLWCDPEPVALTGYTGPTPNGIRIGYVYTPPEYRRRGYASALVAAVSQMLLDRGRKFCFLFTDMANPTSNHIYQEIGYEYVGDAKEYVFD